MALTSTDTLLTEPEYNFTCKISIASQTLSVAVSGSDEMSLSLNANNTNFINIKCKISGFKRSNDTHVTPTHPWTHRYLG